MNGVKVLLPLLFPLLAISLCVHLCVSLQFASVKGNPGDRNNYSNLFNHTLSLYSHRMNNSIVSARVCVLFMLDHLKRVSLLSLSNSRVAPSTLTWYYCSPGLCGSCIKKPDWSITSSSRHGVPVSLSHSLSHCVAFISLSLTSLSAPLIWRVCSLQTGSRRKKKKATQLSACE